jgi:hypothetical protein
MTTTRTAVRVTCDNGNTWTTGFNGTLAEAKAYFVGKVFTEEDEHGRREIMNRVISCEQI